MPRRTSSATTNAKHGAPPVPFHGISSYDADFVVPPAGSLVRATALAALLVTHSFKHTCAAGSGTYGTRLCPLPQVRVTDNPNAATLPLHTSFKCLSQRGAISELHNHR